MANLSFKISYPIIIAGLFIMVSFLALNYNNLNPAFYIVFFFLATYVFLFGFTTGENFATPVKKLLKKVNDLNKGDLKSRFYLESKDELGQLANAFNEIADKLEQSNTENEKTKKSVGIKVEAETQSLKEVINALEQKVQNRTLELQKNTTELEKYKKDALIKESTISGLKNQIEELNKKIIKREVKKEKKEVAPIDGNEEKTDIIAQTDNVEE